jgi:hypothetical protein
VNRNGSIPTDNPFFTTATGLNRAIVGGAFYSPMTARFPADYLKDYFFCRLLRRMDSQAGSRQRQHRHHVCDRHRVARRSEGG